MRTHNIYFHGKIRKYWYFSIEKYALSANCMKKLIDNSEIQITQYLDKYFADFCRKKRYTMGITLELPHRSDL